MDKDSKNLGIRDPGYDRAKEFIKYLLGSDKTYGMDIDSIYFDGEKWIVMEFLFTDIMEQGFGPHESHPHRYPWNWKKFVNLYKLSADLNGELWLVNFAWDPQYLTFLDKMDKEKREHFNQVRLMVVEGINWESLQEYIKNSTRGKKIKYWEYLKIKQDCKLTIKQFQEIYRTLNNDSRVNFKSAFPEIYKNPSPKRSPQYRDLLNKYCQKYK